MSQVSSNRKAIRLAVALLVLSVLAGFAWLYHSRQVTAERTAQARALALDAQKVRTELTELYKERLLRAKTLLSQLHAAPLKPEWTQSETWTTQTDSELAQFDLVQNSISNHLSEVFTKTKSSSQTSKLIAEFERFEQNIVAKRKQYFELYRHLLSESKTLRAEPPIEVPPIFPLEKQWAEKSDEKP